MQLFLGEFNQNVALLSIEESKHFAKVLRGKVGQSLLVTDGKGKMGKGKVSEIHSKSVVVEIEEWIENTDHRDYKIHIAIAPTKSMDRLEFFLEKATEIGIDEITFLNCFHSERKNIKLERCQKIVNSAVKQSLKSYIPKVNDLTKFNDFIKQEFDYEKLIAHCNTGFSRNSFRTLQQPKNNYLILIGPEGDFSTDEIEVAEKNGFKGVSLGNQRLRTETAALSATFAINWIN